MGQDGVDVFMQGMFYCRFLSPFIGATLMPPFWIQLKHRCRVSLNITALITSYFSAYICDHLGRRIPSVSAG